MSERTLELYLRDVQRLLILIRQYTDGKTFTEYTSEPMLRSAVEREFITIGEALNGIKRLSLEAATTIPQLSQIVSFRNVLVHGYHAISDRRVWTVIEEDLDALQTAIDALIDRS